MAGYLLCNGLCNGWRWPGAPHFRGGGVTITLKEIRALDLTRFPTPTKLITDMPPPVPSPPAVTGGRGIIRVQWTTLDSADGYDVAVMTSPNLAAPDVNIVRIPGGKAREYTYNTGN